MDTWLHAVMLADGNGGKNDSDGPPIFFYIIPVVVIVVGIFSAVRPDLMWRASRWQYKNKDAFEPSRAGLVAQRIGGIAAAIFGVVFIIVAASH